MLATWEIDLNRSRHKKGWLRFVFNYVSGIFGLKDGEEGGCHFLPIKI